MSFPYPTSSHPLPDASLSRPTRLRPVTLTHLTPISAGSSQTPPSQGAHLRTSTGATDEADGGTAADPFLRGIPIPSTAPPVSAAASNVAKWAAFGLDTAPYVGGPLTPPPPLSAVRPVPPVAPRAAPTHREVLDVEAEVLLCGSSTASHPTRDGHSQPPLAAYKDPAFAARAATVGAGGGSVDPAVAISNNTSNHGGSSSGGGGGSGGAIALLRRQLSELSNRVSEAAEWERCGPPRPGRGGGRGSHPFPRRGAAGKSQRPDPEETREERANEQTDAADDAGGVPDKSTEGRKRTRVSGGGKPRGKQSAQGPKRKKGDTGGDGGGGLRAGPWQSLFPLPGSAQDGAASEQGLPHAGATNHTPRAGALSVPAGGSDAFTATTAAATAAAVVVPLTRLHTRTEADALFSDVEASLHDPDRIQAPPLFLGLLFKSGDTNFSLSSRSRGKALMPLPETKVSGTPRDPRRADRDVADIVVRWRDRVMVLSADSLGFSFVLRVLRELVGVELITFDAPAVLLPLLAAAAAANDELTTHCVSDVRVMAWMASLSAGGAIPDSAEAPAVVHDFSALFEQYGGGRSAASALGVVLPAVGPDGHPAALQRLVNETYHLAAVYRTLYGLLGARGLLQAFLRQEKRIPLLVATMKREGLRVDLREVYRFREHCGEQMRRWRERACALVPQLPDFNIQSPDQVRVALYEVLQLGKYLTQGAGDGDGDGAVRNGEDRREGDARLTTKGGKLSTAEEALRLLARHHEFPRCVMNYRRMAKILQTYVEGVMSFAVPMDAEGGLPLSSAEACEGARRAGEEGTRGEDEEEGEQSETGARAEDSIFQDVALIGRSSQDVSGARADCDTERAAEEQSEEGDCSSGTRPAPPPQPSAHSPGASPAAFATLHPNFLQEGTDTGRLSCVEPNLQSLPRTATRADAGADHVPVSALTPSTPPTASSPAGVDDDGEGEPFLFRRCFVAPPGHTLLSVDYQQIELRVLAHLCGDAALIAALSGGNADIHRAIAEIVFRKSPVSAEERNMSKRVVFGVLYGAGPRTLAAQMGVTVEHAIYTASLLKSAFPQIHTYHQKIVEQGREDGYVRTLSGRMRQLPDLNAPVMGKRAYAERQAFNTVVQGSAADVMKMAMLAVERDVLGPMRGDVRLLMQIHDEMVFAVRSERLAVVVPMVSKAMSRAMSLLVPLHVSAKIGPSLGALQEWTVDHELGLA